MTRGLDGYDGSDYEGWEADARIGDPVDRESLLRGIPNDPVDPGTLLLVLADALAEARAEVERLRANQLPDGGEWQYGVRWEYRKSKSIDWLSGTEEQVIAYVAGFDGKAIAVKRWIGPAQPLSDVLATPDPNSATQTAV